MKVNLSQKSQDMITMVIIFVFIYLIFAKPIFNWLGITKSKGDRIRLKELSDPDSPFKTNYWRKYYQSQSNPRGKKLTSQRVTELHNDAKQIYDAFGVFKDDEDKISSAFFDLKSKAEVSIMSYYFENSYKKDLLTYLANGKDLMPQNGLGDYELNIILDYVSSLKTS